MSEKMHYELSVINGILFALLLLGCVYQVFDISHLFFSRQTNINVKLEKEAVVEVPAVTLCTNVSNTLDSEYLAQVFGQQVNESTPKWLQTQYLQRLAVKEQLLNGTVSPDHLFETCHVLKTRAFDNSSSEDMLNCSQVAPIKQYLNIFTKCYTIMSQLDGQEDDKYRIDHDISVSDNGFFLMQMFLNKRYLDALYVFIHSRHIPFLGAFGVQSSDLQIYPTRYQGYSLSYSKTTTRLLEAPYETNCFDYTKIGFKSQSDCIVKCKTEYFKRQHKQLHPYIHRSSDTAPDYHFADASATENKSLDRLMSSECADTCGKNDNCYAEYFDIKIVEKWNNSEVWPQWKEGVDQLFDLRVYLPTGITMKYIHSPRLLTSEYICYLASIVNLWFGLSILTCSKIIFAIYYIIFTKTRGVKNSSNYYCFL